MDCLKTDGNEPVAKETLTMLVIVGARVCRHSLSSDVGIGSRSHCLFGDDFIRRVISSTVAGWKPVRLTGGDEGAGVCGEVVDAGVLLNGAGESCPRKMMRMTEQLQTDQWKSLMERIWVCCGEEER